VAGKINVQDLVKNLSKKNLKRAKELATLKVQKIKGLLHEFFMNSSLVSEVPTIPLTGTLRKSSP
jgi:hypothetical protein